MNRSIRSLVTSVAVAVCLWPAGVAAQSEDASSAGPTVSAEDLRGSFASAGYQVAPAQTWDWTAPPVTSFQIRDQATARVLMVLVYANSAAAQTARLQAQAQDPTVCVPPTHA